MSLPEDLSARASESGNPYAPPSPRVTPSSNDRAARGLLLTYRRYHDRPPTVWSALADGGSGLGVSLVLGVLLLAGQIGLGWAQDRLDPENRGALSGALYLAFGVVIGRFFTQLALIRRFIGVWPIIRQIIDWRRVDHYLEKGDYPPGEDAPRSDGASS